MSRSADEIAKEIVAVDEEIGDAEEDLRGLRTEKDTLEQELKDTLEASHEQYPS